MQADIANDPITNFATIIISFGLLLTLAVYIVTLKKYISAAPFRFFAQLVIMISLVVSLAAYLFINQVTANSVIIVTAGFSGLVLGMLLFGTRKIFVYKGRVEIKRGVIPIFLIMLAYLASSIFNVFGNPNLMSLGVVIVVFATGIAMGSATADSINGITMDAEGKKKRSGVRTAVSTAIIKEQPDGEIEEKDKADGPLPI
jgi:hypothetical protein